MIIGLTGKKESGKDTAGDYLVKYYKFKKDSFARPLKDACKILFHLTGKIRHAIIWSYGNVPLIN